MMRQLGLEDKLKDVEAQARESYAALAQEPLEEQTIPQSREQASQLLEAEALFVDKLLADAGALTLGAQKLSLPEA